MLATTKTVRDRTRVQSIDEDGTIHCSIYPTITSRLDICLRPGIEAIGLDVKKLAVGDQFDVLMAGNQVVSIEKPLIHPFDVKTLHPKGLRCLTAIINKAAEGVYGAVTAEFTCGGKNEAFRITSLTKMWQAQADDDLRQRIYKGLKPGTAVNIWVDPESNKPVNDVLYLSVIYR